MAKWRKKIWLMVGLVFLILALVAVSCAPAPAPGEVKEKKVRLGIQLDLTGAIATSGAPLSWGAFDYLAYVNDTLGGVEYRTPDGKMAKVKLDILWEDNGHAVPKVIGIYKRQKAAGVDLMAIFGSTPGESIVGFASRERMPILGYYASTSPVNVGSEPNYYIPYFGNIAEQAAVVIKWFKDTWTEPRKPRVGFMCVDLPSLRPADDPRATSAYAEKLGYEWLGMEWLSPAPTDTTIELTKMRAKEVDLLLTYHVLGGTTVIAKDAARLEMDKRKVTFVAPDWGIDESFPQLAGEAAENYFGWRCTLNPDEEAPGIRLAKEISERYGHWEATCLYLSGVHAALVIVEGLRIALEEVGYEGLNSEVILRAYTNMKDFDPLGLTPPDDV